ncbi:MAG: glycosyltransferase family 2 protein [Bacteroidales bacterium]
MDPLVSVIIPSFNEEKYISSLLDNILQQDYPAERLEVFIIDGLSSDRTQAIIGEYHTRYPYIKLIINNKRFVPFALNLGISASSGEVIVRMDVHSQYPVNYISKLVHSLISLDADNVGGVWITNPANDSQLANAIAVAQSSAFGVGDSHFRLGVSEVRKVDTVPYGCFRRPLFDRIGMFDEELLRNQDDEFNARIIENGGSIYLIPDVAINYFARPGLSSLSKMFFQYALFKPLVNKKLKKPATIRQFIPPLFVLFLLTGWLPAFISPILLFGYAAGMGIYLLANLLFTLKSALNTRKGYLVFFLPWIFLLQHLSYGIGYLAGIIKFVLFNKAQTTIISSR